MILVSQFIAIVDLLATECDGHRTHSYRAIARLTGASRGTVARIASGQHPYQLGSAAKNGIIAVLPVDGPIDRCPTCGRWIALPCHACRTRRLLDAGQLSPLLRPVAAAIEPLGLDLEPPDQDRYVKVHRRHVAGEAADHQSEPEAA